MSVYENFDEQKQFACRVIADHARSTAFAIADGILPGNEGRNYVLRKIMRRAIYHGREHLGFEGLFFNKVCDFVVGQMKDAFPELEIQRDFIGKIVKLEEVRFNSTIAVGLQKFLDESKNISYDEIFEKYCELILEENPNRQSELEEEINKMESERDEKMSSGNLRFYVDKMHKYQIPPYIFKDLLIKKLSEYWGMSDEVIDRAIYYQIKDFGNEREKLLLSDIEEKHRVQDIKTELVSQLNSIYNGVEDLKLKNFTDYARYYDTYGLPIDLIKVLLEEKGFVFDEESFNKSFNTALSRIQNQSDVGKTKQAEKINPLYADLQNASVKSNFHGYDKTEVESAKVLALVKNDERVEVLDEGEEGLIVLDETPFYAEAGGQVGDTGILVRTAYGSGRLNPDNPDVSGSNLQPSATADGSDKGAQVKVFDTFAPVAGIVLHKSKVEKGSIKVGDEVTATVDVEKRDATRRNHTATHLVHAALKEVLGTHVKQAGSVVAPNYLRFDFTHYQPISESELKEIEDLVNRYILQNEPVATNEMAIEEAMRSGAVALFGEKYGSSVRVLSVGGGEFSRELCGGTHVRATGDIGSFKITNDEAIASGVRRIRAITGFDAFERFREDERLIAESLNALKTQRDNLPAAIERLQEELKKARRENDELKMKIATGAVGGASANGDDAKDISGVKVIAKIVEGLDKSGMRHLSDTLMSKIKSGVVVLGRSEDDKVSFIVRVSDDLTDRVKAGKIVQEIAPIVSGRGGGKPDMAEGGGTDASKLSEALEASYKSVEQMLG